MSFIKSNCFEGRVSQLNKLIALALLIKISIEPNSSTTLFIENSICSSNLISVFIPIDLTPKLWISSTAEWIVPGSLGWGISVFANTAILAPIEANFLAIPKPIPLEAPVITTFLFLKPSIYFSNTKIFIKKSPPD